MTDRQNILRVIQESTGPSHYLVQFDCDECISVITHKQLLRPANPAVNGECWVNWNGEEYSAKVLALGDQEAVKQMEANVLKHLDQSTHQISSEEEKSSPPRKKRRLGLKKKSQGTKKEKPKQRKKTTKQTKQKSNAFSLEIGSPAMSSPPKDSLGTHILVHTCVYTNIFDT